MVVFVTFGIMCLVVTIVLALTVQFFFHRAVEADDSAIAVEHAVPLERFLDEAILTNGPHDAMLHGRALLRGANASEVPVDPSRHVGPVRPHALLPGVPLESHGVPGLPQEDHQAPRQ